MSAGELLQIAARLTDHTKHLTVECHLEHPPWPRAFPQEQHLVRSARHAQGVGSADPVGAPRRWRLAIDRFRLEIGWDLDLPLPQVLAIGVEDLHALVAAIADVHVVALVDCNRVRKAELARSGSRFAPRLHPVAVLVVLGDARIDVSVRDVDVALRVKRHVGRLPETAITRRKWWRNALPWFRVVRGLLLAAKHPLHATGLVELDDHVRALVDGPDIVVLVDANAVRECPPVEPFADLADKLSLRAELEKLRRSRTIGGTAGAVRAREHVDTALGIDRDTRYLAEV